MQIADIVIVKGQGVISEAIEDIEDSIYSHVAGIVKENEIIEAQGFQKTGFEGLDKYKGMADIFTCDILTDEQRLGIIKYVESEVGSHYDWLLLFLEGIRYLFNVMLPYKEEFHSHICSTLWAYAYRSVGVDLCSVKYPSPRDISESKLLRKIDSL